MKKPKYDIFISYRKDGGAQYARIIQLKLIERGYRVFLDYDELTDGIFGENIRRAIDEASIFIAILSPKYLLRCVYEGDWVRHELKYALKIRKHFVTINPDNTFDGIPEGIPVEIAEKIGNTNHCDISFGENLNATIDKLIKHRIEPILGNPEDKNKWLSIIKEWIYGRNIKENLIDTYRPNKVGIDIFISYRRIDGRDHARNIQQALKAHGYQRFFF